MAATKKSLKSKGKPEKSGKNGHFTRKATSRNPVKTQSNASQPSPKLPSRIKYPSRSSDIRKPQESFSIVGIGASAGGLEAFEEFFTHMPSDSGLAFVVVPHQSPTHTSLLPGLLQKCTSMPVLEVTDGLAVKPDTVYLALAGKNLALLNGTLHVMDPAFQDRLPLPIDYLVRALAEYQTHDALGRLLPGTSSDCTVRPKRSKAARAGQRDSKLEACCRMSGRAADNTKPDFPSQAGRA